MGIVCLVLLLLLMVGVHPIWRHTPNWGYAPSWCLGMEFLILLAMLILGLAPVGF